MIEARLAEERAARNKLAADNLSRAVQNMSLNKIRSKACNKCSYQFKRDEDIDEHEHDGCKPKIETEPTKEMKTAVKVEPEIES